MKPAKSSMPVLKQVVEQVPAYLVPKLARTHGVERQSRSFTPWSHVVSLVHTQLAHSLSLNDRALGSVLFFAFTGLPSGSAPQSWEPGSVFYSHIAEVNARAYDSFRPST